MGKDSNTDNKKEKLIEALLEYSNFVRSRKEGNPYRLFGRAKALVPNADLSDMFFYSERERSIDEVADEAVSREAIYEEQGRAGLRAYLIKSMEEVCENSAASRLDIKHARMKLDELYKENSKD